jgi:putative sterol carrier protein
MAKWLTQEWLDEGKKLAEGQPEHPGASARVQYVITGGPEGDIRYYWVLENGQLLDSRLGELPDADVTLTENYDDAMRIQKGELDANAAFMQGRVKVTGNMAKLMAMLPITNSAEYKQLQAETLAITEF